ncbi:MAG TPA: hypothetical protein VKC62_02310 [Gaiellaceae bacterium]|nr:hypothetical protein [Gaiellaceae bacterium]
MLDAEPVILEELHRLAASDDAVAPAWEEIVRRSGRGRRGMPATRAALYALAAVVVVWLAAPAFGVQPPFLDFFSSKPAPKRVVHSFEVMSVVAPRGMSPKIIAGQTRRVTAYRLRDGKTFALFVAPRKGGNGFCFQFGYGGGCADRTAGPRNEPGDVNGRLIGLGRYGSHVLAGYVYDQRIDHLQVRFADGSTANVPLIWVSPPIDAGFFLYDLTYAQRHPAQAPTAVLALDAQGQTLAKNRYMFAPKPTWFDPRKVSDPAHKRVILRSGKSTIAVSPARTGGYCWWLQYEGRSHGSGCAPPRYLTTPMAGGLSHGTHFTTFSAQLQKRVVRVELRFQNGVKVELQPVDGFVLYDIPAAHWPRGTRLTAALAFDAAGHRLARKAFDPLQTGTYDCIKQVPIGAGETACP